MHENETPSQASFTDFLQRRWFIMFELSIVKLCLLSMRYIMTSKTKTSDGTRGIKENSQSAFDKPVQVLFLRLSR